MLDQPPALLCKLPRHCHAYNEPIILTMIKLLHVLDDHSVTTPSRESTQFFFSTQFISKIKLNLCALVLIVLASLTIMIKVVAHCSVGYPRIAHIADPKVSN